MTRFVLTDAQWERIEPHCLGKATDPGRTGGDARRFLEAVLWIARTGAPWRDLPEEFGNWNTGVQAVPALGQGRCFQTHIRGAVRRSGPGVRDDRRQHRQGPPSRTGRKRGTQSQAIGHSRGGWSTKIVALADALGNLVGFELLPGHRFDTLGVAPLIEGIRFGGLIADKAFDVDWILAELDARGAEVVISQHPRRIPPRHIDAAIYTWRHLIENFFGKLKELKRIALRACKTDTSFAAMIYLVATVINSR
jgi:transposase